MKAPLLVHVGLLAIVVTVGVLLTSPGVPFFSDEGAGIIEAQLIERTGSWVEPNPFPAVDPTSAARTLPNADVGTKGRAPYGRHPLYVWLLEAADKVFGSAGFVVLSVAGAVLAATGAALLAREIDPRLAVPTLWLTGVASPLVFDSGLVVAHTAAAAAAAAAGLLLLACLRAPARRAVVAAAVLTLVVAVGTGLRTEGGLFGLAIAGTAALALAVGWRSVTRVGAASAAVGAAVAVLVMRRVEHILGNRHYGPPVASNLSAPPPLPAQSWLSARYHGFVQTWFVTGYHPSNVALLSLTVSFVAVAIAATLVRRRRRPDLAAFALVLAVLAVVLKLADGHLGAIGGIAVVFPAGWFAVWAVRRGDLDSTPARVLASVAVLFTLGVLATQYDIGGGIEWGARYLAMGLPLAAPLVGLVVLRRADGLDRSSRRSVLVSLGVASALFAVMALATLAHGHDLNRRAQDAIRAEVAPAGDGGLPVVLTAERFVPQIISSDYFKYRWLVPPSSDETYGEHNALGTYAARLADAHVSALVLITSDPAHDLAAAAPFRLVRATEVPEFRVTVPPGAAPVTIALMRVG